MYAIVFNFYMFGMMFPLSYINEQTRFQIRQIIEFRKIVQRVVRDRRVLMSNPIRIEHRVQQIAVKEYKRLTAHLSGEEREEKMLALAEKTYETLTDAMD